ncbi:MAG: hypothetical protein DRJ41_02360 [Thermoprotei archaeon]|nr:MAG: hypothetical protein DRJ41_02360 [Thermoprotei archaeon]
MKRNTYLKTLAIVLIFTLALILTPQGISEERVVLTIEYGEPWKLPVTWALEIFREKYPEVDIRLIMIPYGIDYNAVLAVDLAAGTAGDVFGIDSFLIPEFAEAGYLYDLSDFVKEWPEWEKFSEPMRKIVAHKGKVYGIMIDTDVRMIWYRKDIFRVAGLPEVWQPTTWEEIIDTALKLQEKKEEIMKAMGVDEFYPIYVPAGTKWGEATTMQGFYMILLGADKDPYNRLYDYEEEKWVGKSKALLRTFEFYYDIYVKHKIAPVEYNFVPDVWAHHRKTFAEGKIGMELGGSWEWGEAWGPTGIAPVPEREKKIGFAKMPGIKGGAEGERKWVTISGGWAFAVNAKIPEEKLKYALEFLKILHSKEIIAKYCAEFGKVSPRVDAVEVEEYAKDPYLTAILEYVTFTDFRDALPGYTKVSYFVQKVTEEIITKGITPEEALEMYYKLLVEEFGADKVITYPLED